MQNKISHIKKTIAVNRGMDAEQKTLSALNSTARPHWIYSARKSDPHQDRKGIDILVSTDVGDLFLQIKSSTFFKNKFIKNKKEHHSKYIATAVVHIYYSQEEILQAVLCELEPLRNTFLNKRFNKQGEP